MPCDMNWFLELPKDHVFAVFVANKRLLCYCRGGELVETLAGSDEFGEFFKKEDVEWLLDAHLYLDNK